MEGELTQLNQARKPVHSSIPVLSISPFKQATNKCFLNASQNSTQMLSVLLTSLLRWAKYVYTGIQRK